MSTGRIRITSENLDTGDTVVRTLEADEWAVIYGPDMEALESPLPLRHGARITIREKPFRYRASQPVVRLDWAGLLKRLTGAR